MADEFSTEVVYDDDAIVIHVRGEIDLATVAHLRDAIEPHLGPKQTIMLDLSEVRFMDSSFLRLLVQARGRLTPDGDSLLLRNPSEAARRLLTIAETRGLIALSEVGRPGAAVPLLLVRC